MPRLLGSYLEQHMVRTMNPIWQGSMYGLVVIAGFIILGAAIAYAMIRNKRTPREEQRTEEATRRLYEEGTVGEGQGRRE